MRFKFLLLFIGLILGAFTFFHFYFVKSNTLVKNKSFDALIVFGFPSFSNGKISPTLKSRMDKAITVYNANKFKYLFLLGGAAHNQIVESEVMRNYAIENGIERKFIYIDSLSNTTIENTMNLLQIIDNQDLKVESAVLISSKYHLHRIAGLIENNSKIKYLNVGAKYPKSIGLFGEINALFREIVMWFYHLLIGYKLS